MNMNQTIPAPRAKNALRTFRTDVMSGDTCHSCRSNRLTGTRHNPDVCFLTGLDVDEFGVCDEYEDRE